MTSAASRQQLSVLALVHKQIKIFAYFAGIIAACFRLFSLLKGSVMHVCNRHRINVEHIYIASQFFEKPEMEKHV